jgi:hypothetical protein
MKLWLLERVDNDEFHYDENEGFVIAAPNELRAREIANDNRSDEGEIWEKVEEVTCREITKKEPEGVVLLSYWAA